MLVKIIMASLLLAGCSNEPRNLRTWTPEDHAHAPDMQIDPNRVPQADAPRMTVGELLWQQNCARCHGTDGRGGRQVQLSFASEQWQSQIDDAQIARTIAGGKPPNMPAFADLLTPKQITSLVGHIRTLGSGD